MITGKSLTELAQEIDRQQHVKHDIVANTDNMELSQGADLRLSVGTNREREDYTVNSVALNQIGTKMGIPNAYMNKIEKTSLLEKNVNFWLSREQKPMMVRTLDGTARAFLSDRYKRIDNYPVLESILPIIQEAGVNIQSSEVTDTRMHLKLTSPKYEGEVAVGDAIQMGLYISNSEVGLGSFQVKPLIYRLVCDNGMIMPQAFGESLIKKHLGARQPEGVLYREDTIDAHQRTFALMVRDIIQQLLSQDAFESHLARLKVAAHNEITGNVEASVKELGKIVGIRKTEGSRLMNHLVSGGDLSQYGMLNAVTRMAHMEKDITYDRSTELEEIGGKILTLKPSQWKRIAEAA